MTPPWTVRKVRAADASVIAGHRYFRGEPQDDVDAYASWLPHRIDRADYLGFVAEMEGRVVAGAGAVLLDWGPAPGDPCGRRARIVNVFTEEWCRKQGIARALVERVLGACSERGIGVYSLAASERAAPMYRSLGFEPYAHEMILRRR